MSHTPMRWPIDTLNVKPGDLVTKGQVLAQLDQRDYQRRIEVIDSQIASDNQHDRDRIGLQVAQAQLDGLIANRRISQDQLRDTQINAPFTVRCDPAFGLTSVLEKRLKPAIEAIWLPPGYTLAWGGEGEEGEEAQSKIAGAIPYCLAGMPVPQCHDHGSGGHAPATNQEAP